MECDYRKSDAAAPEYAAESAARPAMAKQQFLKNIENLWLEGYSTCEIAEQLGEMPRVVGRNLREIRKRQQRASLHLRKHYTGFGEPLGCFIVPALECAQTGH